MKKLLPLLLLVLAMSCQKEYSLENNKPKPTITGVWKFVSFKEGTVHDTNANPCFADNTLTLGTDSIAVLDQGPCLDDPAEPRTENVGKYSSNGKTLTLMNNTNEIFQLTDSTLWFGKTTGPEIYEYRWKK